MEEEKKPALPAQTWRQPRRRILSPTDKEAVEWVLLERSKNAIPGGRGEVGGG